MLRREINILTCFKLQYDTMYAVMVLMSGGAWSEILRVAAVKHFVVAALWYFLRGAALTFFVGAT